MKLIARVRLGGRIIDVSGGNRGRPVIAYRSAGQMAHQEWVPLLRDLHLSKPDLLALKRQPVLITVTVELPEPGEPTEPPNDDE